MRYTIQALSLLLILFLTFTSKAQVANDDCSGAITLTPSVSPSCTYTTGTFSGSVQGTIPCMTGSHQDVWYQFVATEEVMRVSIPNTTYLNVGFEIIDGSCAGSSIACVNNNSTSYGESYTSDQYVIGNTYFVRVYNANTSLSSLDFDICVQSYPPPSNDDCSGAITLTPSVSPTCNYTSGSFYGSSYSNITCMTGDHQDVWYQFVATEEVMRVSIPNTTYLNVGFEIIDGSCTGSSIACVNNNSTSYGESYTSDQYVIGNTYFVRVYNANTSLSSLDFDICIQSYPPPSNDDCSGAITLTPSVSPTCNYTSGSFYGSSYSNITCMTGDHQDVWYQFVATEEVMRVSIPNTTYLNVGFEIIDGSCTGSSIACVNNNSTSYGESYTSDQYVIGNTYFVRVYNANTSLSSLDFDICVQSYPPPSNDDCSGAITLTPSVSPTCNYTSGSFYGSSYSNITCMTGDHQDVWYQFVATEEVMRVSIPNTTYLNVGFEIIDGSCAGSSIACVNNNSTSYGESYTSDQYVIGNTYFVRVYNANTSLSSLDFDICIQSYPPPSNEDCSGAITLTPSVSPTCNYTSGSFYGSSYSNITCMTGDHQDVWYQFVATEEVMRVSIPNTTYLNVGFEIIDGSCSGSSIACVNNNSTSYGESYTSDQYVIGNTYFVRVYNANTSLSSLDFDICIQSYPPPSNDDCSGAISLTPSISPNCNFTTGTFYGAVQNPVTCETGNRQDVWYQFTATSATHKIFLSAESGLNHGFEVIDGSCTGTSLLCVDNNSTSYSETNTSGFYVVGNTYFIRVYNSNSTISSLDFDICIESFPVSLNDDCADAITLTPSVSPNCNYVTGSFSGAADGAINCMSGNHQDVWYQFTATATTHKISLSAESGLNHGFEVIDGSCTGASLACINNNGTSFSESYIDDQYIVGNTYFVRVYNANTGLSSSDFDICIESYAPPANEDCSNAVILTPSISPNCNYTTGTFYGSVRNAITCETGNHQDVWYQFTATATTHKISLTAESGLNHGFEVIDGSCTGASLVCVNNNGTSFSESYIDDQYIVGNTYFVRVFNANTNITSLEFDICIESYAPPANEDCSNAVTLTPSVSPNCNYTTGTFYGSVRNAITCETGNHQDVWYQFTATSTTHKVSLSAESGLNHGFEVIDGSCTGTNLLCVNNNGTSFSESNTSNFYVIGNTYFVRVFNANTNIASLDFDICIESFPVAPNDDCADAISLTPGVSPNCNFVTGSFSGAAQGVINCETGNHQDVWYQFTATAEVMKVTLGASSGLNHGFEIIDGSCTGTSIVCVNNNGSSFGESYIAGTYTIGNTYFIRVYNAATTLSSLDFEICVESFAPPANDDCSDAIELTAGQTCSYTSGTLSGSGLNTLSCETGMHQDVWYSFVATNDTMYVGLEASNDLDHGFEVLDACGGTSLNCTNAHGVSSSELEEIINLTVGNTYYVRVYNANTNVSEHSFGICVYGQDQSSSLNDLPELMGITIFPNPSESGIFFLKNAELVESIVVYDVTLKEVMHKTNLLNSIDLSQQNAGVYFVKCISAGGQEIIKRIVKE